jgi:hypothetical protein
LLIDEITLAVKSTVEGLCKVSKLKPPPTSEYESLSRLAFASCGKTPQESMSANFLTLAEFLAYVNASPTTSSWMGYYDDINQSNDNADSANGASSSASSSPTTILTPCPDFAGDDSDAAAYGAAASMASLSLLNQTTGQPNATTLKKFKPTSGAGTWYKAPVIDESFVPTEGDENTVKYLEVGTPCYAALTELLRPEGKVS